MKSSTNQQVAHLEQLSDAKAVDKPFYHYHYSTSPCHRNASGRHKQLLNKNVIEASIILKVKRFEHKTNKLF